MHSLQSIYKYPLKIQSTSCNVIANTAHSVIAMWLFKEDKLTIYHNFQSKLTSCAEESFVLCSCPVVQLERIVRLDWQVSREL